MAFPAKHQVSLQMDPRITKSIALTQAVKRHQDRGTDDAAVLDTATTFEIWLNGDSQKGAEDDGE